MSLLVCTGLHKTYPGGKKAVQGIDFYVDRGEIVGLLGPNGAGKTTTFRMACGLVTPTAGRVVLRGTDVTTWPLYRRARHGMGYLPQDAGFHPGFTVFEWGPWSRGTSDHDFYDVAPNDFELGNPNPDFQAWDTPYFFKHKPTYGHD